MIERATIEVARDQFEIGYPEKFMKMLNEWAWKVDALQRGGRFHPPVVAPDRALLALLTGIEGENHLFYTCMASPKYRASWARAVTNSGLCLRGNESLRAPFCGS